MSYPGEVARYLPEKLFVTLADALSAIPDERAKEALRAAVENGEVPLRHTDDSWIDIEHLAEWIGRERGIDVRPPRRTAKIQRPSYW